MKSDTWQLHLRCNWGRNVLVIMALCTAIAGRVSVVWSGEPTLDQKLIIACNRVDIRGVVLSLRMGANVGATFGQFAGNVHPLTDPWYTSTHVAVDSFTPLLALAEAPYYPDPPKGVAVDPTNRQNIREVQSRFDRATLEARREAELTILHILISHGAQADRGDSRGGTALHFAVDNNKKLLLRALLEYGANPNTTRHIYIDGSDNITPLHSASGSKEDLQLLLKYGANARAKDSKGRTPADWVELHANRDFDLVITPDGPVIVPRSR